MWALFVLIVPNAHSSRRVLVILLGISQRPKNAPDACRFQGLKAISYCYAFHTSRNSVFCSHISEFIQVVSQKKNGIS